MTTGMLRTKRIRSRMAWVPKRRAVHHVLFALALLVVWQLFSGVVGPLFLPPVDAIAAAFFDLVVTGQLPRALGQSLVLLVVGLLAATAIGFFFGILIGRSRIAHWTLSPYFSALFVTPTVALVPLVLIWFGFGFTGRCLVVVLAAVVPILLSVSSALRDDPGELVEVAKSFGLRGELALLRHVRLRAADGKAQAAHDDRHGRAVVGMAVAETYLRLGGIGGLIRSYGSLFQTDYVFAAILPLSFLGIGLTALVGRVERRFQGWQS